MERRLAAILAADVVGFSRLMGDDEAGTYLRFKALHEAVTRPLLAEHRGRVVKTTGDGFLALFDSAADGVDCALALQAAWQEAAQTQPVQQQLVFRLGVNLGDVILADEDISGDGVNIAVRLEGLAEPGGLCISEMVRQSILARPGAAFRDLGERQLKNITRPIRVWAWQRDGTDEKPRASPAPTTLPERPSVLVLPFVNLSGDPEQEYFSDGITEDIVTELSRFRSLTVIGRKSALQHPDRGLNRDDLGQALGVRYVVEGSVRKRGKQVRVACQLLEATSGKHLWAEHYDRELEDIFSVQDEITRAIAAAIEPELANLERTRARSKPLAGLDAWDWYQRALWHAYKDTQEDFLDALGHCETAIALSPDFAPPYALCGFVRIQDIINGYSDASKDILQRAASEAERAVGLDDKDAFAHMALGRIQLLLCKHEDSIAALETAIRLNPSFADAYHALGFTLIFAGRPAEAVPQFDRAIALSPFDARISSFYEMRAWALLIESRVEDALKDARTALRRPHAQHWCYATLCSILGHLDRTEEAKPALEELLRRKPDFSAAFVRRFVFYNKRQEDLEHYVDGLRRVGLAE